jgi:hypothetical protein
MFPERGFFYAQKGKIFKNKIKRKERNLKKTTRQKSLGIMFADSIIEAAHQTYNASRGRTIIESCIRRLHDRIGEIQPKKADPKYKEARYGKKTY